MSQKVLQISAEDAKYIDPTQIVSLQMVDGSMVYVKGAEQEEGFVEEAQNEQQYQTQEVENEQGQKLRGKGALGAIAGIAAGAALLGTAAAVGSALTKNRRGPMMGPGMMGPGMMRPGMMAPRPMAPPRPGMVAPGMMAPRPMVPPRPGMMRPGYY